MKTLTKSLLAAVLGGAFTVAAIAGPGPQYWIRSVPVPAPKAVKAIDKDSPLTCKHMLMRNAGPGSSRVPFKSVTCTSELMKASIECQNACRS